MKNENRNEEAVSPVIATILMVAITVVLAGVLFVWASSLAEGNTDGNLALYAFSGKDAQGTPGAEGTDNLIMLTMDQGGDINWASISVKLAIDGAAPVTCDNPALTAPLCAASSSLAKQATKFGLLETALPSSKTATTCAMERARLTSPSRTPVKERPSTPPTASLLSEFTL